MNAKTFRTNFVRPFCHCVCGFVCVWENPHVTHEKGKGMEVSERERHYRPLNGIIKMLTSAEIQTAPHSILSLETT